MYIYVYIYIIMKMSLSGTAIKAFLSWIYQQNCPLFEFMIAMNRKQ